MSALPAVLLRRQRPIAALMVLAAITAAAAFLARDVVNDDPYITYRYARNLATHIGFVYNPGEMVLSTTAPLYAVILAGLAVLGFDLPAASIVVGAVCVFGGSALLYRLGSRANRAAPAWMAAILLAASPLVWMAIGMESSLYLALALGAFNASADRRWRLAGLMGGLATLTRGDGLLIVGIVALHELSRRRRAPARTILVAAALIVPAMLSAMLAFGSPLPATLRAKVLQANLGITGFSPGASFLDGFLALGAAYAQHSWLYIAALPLLAAGAVYAGRQRWTWPIIVWGASQAIGYTALGVAPYRWYYIPILPALYVLVGSGVAAPQRSARAAAIGLVALTLIAQAQSVWEIHRSTDPAVPRAALSGFDALPETSGPLYRRVGVWLRDQTAPGASVGVMEVGVIGYYAERRMIDYLGLLQPEVAAALGRGDIYWSIPHTQPDYLVLTAVNPLYSYDLLADAWFQAMYRPVQRFEDSRFWGSPVTVYERLGRANPIEAYPVDQPIGELRLTEYAIEPIALQPRTPIRIRLTWARPLIAEANVSVSLIGPQSRVIATDNRLYPTAMWPASGGSVYHTLVSGDDVPAGLYRALIEVRSTANRGQATIGRWKSPLGEVNPPANRIARADRFGGAIDLIGYTIEPRPAHGGDSIALTLYWQSQQPIEGDYTVFVHLENARGDLVFTSDSQPRGGDYPTSIWTPGETIDDPHVFKLPDDLPAGVYDVSIGLYRLDSGERLAVDGSDQVHLAPFVVEAP